MSLRSSVRQDALPHKSTLGLSQDNAYDSSRPVFVPVDPVDIGLGGTEDESKASAASKITAGSKRRLDYN